MNKIETVRSGDATLAIVVRHDYSAEGISFLTPDDYSQQLAYMKHPKGHVIKPHVHNIVKREILYTREVLVIRKGRLRCDFYTDAREYVESVLLYDGDIVLLVSGGHGFECMTDVEMYEIKQGPYAGEKDKVRFEPEIKNRLVGEKE